MKLFKRKKESASGDEKSPEPVTSPVEVPEVVESNKIKKHVLVIDTVKHDWDALFSQVIHDRFDFVLDQCEWKDIASVTSYNEYSSRKSNNRICTVHMHASPSSKVKARTQFRHFQPDFVIVRKLVNGLKIKSEDWTNALQGFLHAQIPSINSFQSIYMNLQRPLVHGALGSLRDRYGFSTFPLIDQYFYSEPRQMLFHPPLPIVLKVGTAEAGYGKIKVGNDPKDNISGELRDIGGTITRYGDYITAESFINKTHDIRVQKIGHHYRAYTRVSSNWKGNVGNSVLTEVEVTEKYRKWADLAGDELFGGSIKMDILTVDAVAIEGSEEEHILEINDTASGFAPSNENQDMIHVRDLAISRMDALFR